MANRKNIITKDSHVEILKAIREIETASTRLITLSMDKDLTPKLRERIKKYALDTVGTGAGLAAIECLFFNGKSGEWEWSDEE